MKKIFLVVCIIALSFCIKTPGTYASGSKGMGAGKNAIVIASFGSTVPSALQAIINIRDSVQNAYPQTEVRMTFTSNIIRRIWKKRQNEPQKWLDQGVPEDVLYVKNFIATIGDLLEDGFTNIVVQPTHMFFMEQSHDLQQYVNGLASINTLKRRWKPINILVMGRPALGMPGDKYPYSDDVSAVVESLKSDAEAAKAAGATLIYLGHGNKYWSTGIYRETQQKMRERYPDVTTFIGVVEGKPGLDEFLEELREAKTNKVMLKPFMIVAGDHAKNDMAGDEADSWKSILINKGYEVNAVLEGLGSNDNFAAIFVDHIADAARDRHIELK